MKRIMKRNQVVITALAVMLAVAGYLTYAGKQDLSRISGEKIAVNTPDAYDTYVAGTANHLEAAAQVNEGTTSSSEMQSDPTGSQADVGMSESTTASDTTGELSALGEIDSMDYDINDPGEAVLTNGMTVNDYLASARLTREQVRGKNKEELLKIIDDETADSIDRQAAVDKMVELTDNSDKECAAETLLSAKGFDNSIVSITNGKVDVVICKNELSDAELAQIEDIVKRKTDVSAAQIVISLMDVSQ